MAGKIKVEHHSSLGIFWFMGWLFSIGFLEFGFWKGVLALFIWPFFLGAHFADAPPEGPVQVVEEAQ